MLGIDFKYPIKNAVKSMQMETENVLFVKNTERLIPMPTLIFAHNVINK